MKRFILRERSIMQNAVAHIADLDLAQTWEVIVRPHKPRKSDEQRNTLHLWLRRTRARATFRAEDRKPVYLDLLEVCHALLQNRNPFEGASE